jgi:GH15 family glucan-1,4-alpha-glucosidase
VERFSAEGPVERWRTVRDAIHAQICADGFDAQRNTFVQHYGSTQLDASLLLIPLVGFLPPEDPRVRGTVEAIERELVADGLVLRYSSASNVDGLPPGEGVFLPCSFWLAQNLALIGRQQEAEDLFERLLALRNDLGLLSEEYDPRARRMLGNFPQALTHMALINTAYVLSRGRQGDLPVAAGERCDAPAKAAGAGRARP